MRLAHSLLTQHAGCEAAYTASLTPQAEYDSDDEDRARASPCWCLMDDEFLVDARHACSLWPGPICGSCWVSRCAACPYTFEDPRDAASRDAAADDWFAQLALLRVSE